MTDEYLEKYSISSNFTVPKISKVTIVTTSNILDHREYFESHGFSVYTSILLTI